MILLVIRRDKNIKRINRNSHLLSAPRSLLFSSALRANILDQGYVVTLHQNSSNTLPLTPLDVNLLRVIKNQIHVLIKTDDMALNSEILLVKQPHLDPGSVLEEPEDQVDGLDHEFLDLLLTTSSECHDY